MTNELMFQTPAQIVLYVYLIPAAVIIGLLILLSLDDSPIRAYMDSKRPAERFGAL